MDRRSFLTQAAIGGLAGYGLGACAANGSGSSTGSPIDRLGVQLYTLRDRFQTEVPGTLAAIAAIGYREVETAGLYDLTPAAFRAELDRNGLVSPAGHYGIADLRQNFDATLATAQTLGQKWVIVPSLSGDDRTPDGFRRVADELNRFGQIALQRGLRIGYHNHDFEFAAFNDPGSGASTNGFETLLSMTDEGLVDVELDIFWAVRGGEDPIALFRRYPGRFPLCHVKDMADIGGERRMTEVGSGEIDFAGIFDLSELAGLRHFFVEHDTPTDSLASVRSSYEYLRRVNLVGQ